MSRGKGLFFAVLAACMAAGAVHAQLVATDLAAMEKSARAEGWTFSVGENAVTDLPLELLCGLKEPDNWREKSPASPSIDLQDAEPLPAAFDWRSVTGCPPVRNQGNCGACWAFATTGALECAIMIKDGVAVDLSEQWLISCNRNGWNCDGGWFAHEYHHSQADACGGTGAVLESAFPYSAGNGTCQCPYPHAYGIDSWAYVDASVNIPSPQAIKRAIYERGPVSVAVYVDSAFQAYKSGVFNACSDNVVNHAVVLVGWDDNLGTAGAWIARNSWGAGWGESGYMRIAYGCSRVGYGACYVDYPGRDDLAVKPAGAIRFRGEFGGPFSPAYHSYTLQNTGSSPLDWTASNIPAWLSMLPTTGSIAPGESAAVLVTASPAAGNMPINLYAQDVLFANMQTGKARPRTVTLSVGQPDHFTELFENNDNDLSYRSILFTPDGSASFYSACTERITSLPSDPAGGTTLNLGDDASVQVSLGNKSVSLYGSSASRFHVGSNGYVTFGSGDTSSLETLDTHFARRRISALFDDLDPAAGGSVSWKQFADRVAVTWLNVPEYNRTAGNTFQIEMYFNGRIRLAWLALSATDGLAGLSNGSGRPATFVPSDLSSYLPCSGPLGMLGDFDGDCDVDLDDFGHLQACLTGADVALAQPTCANASLDGDDDVDEIDLLIFQSLMTGPMHPTPAGCGQ